MKQFLQNFDSLINGVLHGFDRIILKGHIRLFYMNNNFYYFLKEEHVKLKEFKQYALHVTEDLKAHITHLIESTTCYSEYLTSTKTAKEKIAQGVLNENPDKTGLICVLSVVEPCFALTIKYNSKTGKLEKRNEFRKCLHYYLYYNDRDLGLMHVRFQTWFPFKIQIYINGKEYLKKQLTKKSIEFTSYDNCVTGVSDIQRAQEIADQFIKKDWTKVFDHFASQVNGYKSRIEEIFNFHSYYWYIDECEYASDVLFKNRQTLEKVFPHFIEYASLCQMGENIYTFFGRKLHHLCQGEAVSDRKHFWGQGFRIKFVLDKNFLKLYDKSNVLRIETTINNASAFKILNPNPQGKKKWVPMGKNISNLYRYAEITKKCNERYLESLSALTRNNNLDKAIESLCHPKKSRLSKNSVNERQYNALNPLKDFNCKAFNAAMNGAYMMKGFTTKQLTDALLALNAFSKEQCSDITKLKAKVGRFIAQLRAHKIVTKLPKTHRYRVTNSGTEILSRILMFRKMDLKFC
ncbi:hypothetical protein JW964_24830 [candidate division KSB1 bacterium]|nr:hypothetical protein [candidate division KSB1 bacterium]